jgi:antitoxin VapB
MRRQAKKRRSLATATTAPVAEAKVFMTGRSQAVRLPKAYRVTGETVYVKHLGNGILLLPKTGDRWAGLFEALDQFPRNFSLRRNQKQKKRPGLERLFDRVEA